MGGSDRVVVYESLNSELAGLVHLRGQEGAREEKRVTSFSFSHPQVVQETNHIVVHESLKSEFTGLVHLRDKRKRRKKACHLFLALTCRDYEGNKSQVVV